MMNRELVNFFCDHLAIERRLSPHTITSYSTDLEQFTAFIAPAELLQVKALTIRKWLISLSDDSIQNRSINRKLATLRTFYKYLLRTGKIEENPMTSIRMVKTTKKIPQFVRESEMENLVENRTGACSLGWHDWKPLDGVSCMQLLKTKKDSCIVSCCWRGNAPAS